MIGGTSLRRGTSLFESQHAETNFWEPTKEHPAYDECQQQQKHVFQNNAQFFEINIYSWG